MVKITRDEAKGGCMPKGVNKKPKATVAETPTPREELRGRIVLEAIDLLTEGGREALTTRAVANKAGVQPPTIYRLFGDKKGLLDAVSQHGFSAYLQEKNIRDFGPSPIEGLRAGWDLHVGFGLANPALYSLMYGDPRPHVRLPAAEASLLILKEHIRRIAANGQLRVSEGRAVNMMHAAGCGTVLTLLTMPKSDRDTGLSESAREAAISAIAIITHSPIAESPAPFAAAITLRAVLTDPVPRLSHAERVLLREWLDRLVS